MEVSETGWPFKHRGFCLIFLLSSSFFDDNYISSRLQCVQYNLILSGFTHSQAKHGVKFWSSFKILSRVQYVDTTCGFHSALWLLLCRGIFLFFCFSYYSFIFCCEQFSSFTTTTTNIPSMFLSRIQLTATQSFECCSWRGFHSGIFTQLRQRTEVYSPPCHNTDFMLWSEQTVPLSSLTLRRQAVAQPHCLTNASFSANNFLTRLSC